MAVPPGGRPAVPGYDILAELGCGGLGSHARPDDLIKVDVPFTGLMDFLRAV